VANSESYNPRGWPIFALRSEPFTSPAWISQSTRPPCLYRTFIILRRIGDRQLTAQVFIPPAALYALSAKVPPQVSSFLRPLAQNDHSSPDPAPLCPPRPLYDACISASPTRSLRMPLP
jgi:hypothetical protein